MQVVKVHYQYAFPTFDDNSREMFPKPTGEGWIDEWKNVLIDGDDAQVAVDMVRDEILNHIEPNCSPDVPINTVKGFRLRGVERVCNIDLGDNQ